MAGVYSGTTAISGFFLGSLVDKYKKKKAMMLSSICSLALYIISIIVFIQTPSAHFKDPMSPELWIFIVLSLAGAIAGNMRSIALSTVVTILVPEPQRDKANGFVGSANGVTFLAASIFSGLDYFSLMEEAVKRGYFTTMTQVVERGIELAVEEAVKKGLPNPEELSPATRLLSRIRDAANG